MIFLNKKNNWLLIVTILFLSCSDSQPVIYVEPVPGCMDTTACNYDSGAEKDDGSCNYDECLGCMDATACNYDATANADDGSCEYTTCSSCMDGGACTVATCGYDSPNPGQAACNYDETAITDDGSCEYSSCAGCMDVSACNYNAEATINESCYFNYDELAQLIDSGESTELETDACSMPENTIYVNSSGTVLYNISQDIHGIQFDVDGATISGASGGDASLAFEAQYISYDVTLIAYTFSGGFVPSGCGVLIELTLDGSPSGLSGIVFSDSSGSAINVTYLSGCDCQGGILDCAGVCGGLNDACLDCNGVANGSAVEDCAGVCGGNSAICEVGGECISEETCYDLIGIQQIIDANASLSGDAYDLAGWDQDSGRATHLYLGSKQITTIPYLTHSQSLSEITYLDLSYNNITVIDISPFSKLTSAYLNHNQITALTIGSNLENLRSLYLESNNLNSLPDNIASITSLEALSIGLNSITSLPSLYGLDNLKTIQAVSAGLSSLPESIVSLGSLETLNLDLNQLTTLPSGLCSMSSLLTLTISGNQICDGSDSQCTQLQSFLGNDCGD